MLGLAKCAEAYDHAPRVRIWQAWHVTGDLCHPREHGHCGFREAWWHCVCAIVSLGFVVVFVASPGSVAQAGQATKGGGWRYVALPMTLSNQEDFTESAIACTSLAHCLVGGGDNDEPGGHLMWTSDQGQTWHDAVNRPYSIDEEIDSLSCAGPRWCWAVEAGTGIALSADGGETWRAVAEPPSWQTSRLQPKSVACGAEDCLVLAGNSVFATPADRGHFTPVPPPSPNAWIDEIECAPRGWCLVVYQLGTATGSPEHVVSSTNLGRSWQATAPGPLAASETISCADATHCAALGKELWTTSDLGRTWSATPLPKADNLVDLSCPAVNYCAVLGDVDFQASVWFESTVPLPPRQPSPPDPWAAVSLPPAVNYSGSVSCWTATDCVITGGGADGVFLTTNGGRTWTPTSAVVPGFRGGTDTLSCSSSGNCLAVIDGGNLEGSRDAGAHWQQVPLPAAWQEAQLEAMAVSCTPQGCVVAGDNQNSSTAPVASLIASKDDGRTWSELPAPPHASQAIAIACSPEGTCLFLYGEGQVMMNAVAFSTDDGHDWAVLPVAAEVWGQMTSASCPTATTCYSTGNFILETADAGKTWTEAPAPLGPRASQDYVMAYDISCPGLNDCWLAGAQGNSARIWRMTATRS
jgi:photosystem II stability/assembly factor-like uncharacterized protein